MSRWKKTALICLGTLAVLALLAATVLPVIVRNKAVAILAETTGRTVRIEAIAINPLTLTATIRGFAVEESGGGPFFSLAGLRVSVSPASLYRRALVLSAVAIESPSLRVVRMDAQRFNFTDILERRKKTDKEEKPQSPGLFPFVLNNFKLTGGSLELEDRAVPGGRKHTLRSLEIALPRLSSLPADAEKDAEPRISLVFNGAPLTLEAKTRPFGQALDSWLHVVLKEMSLPELAAYAPQAPPVDLASGKLTVDAEVNFRRPPGAGPEVKARGLVRLDSLDLNLSRGGPLLKLPVLEVRAANLEPLAGLFAIESIGLEGLELFVSRSSRGEWMFQPLLPARGDARASSGSRAGAAAPAGKAASAAAANAPAAPTARESQAPAPAGEPSSVQGKPAAGEKPPLQFALGSLAIRGGKVHFRDDLPQGGFRASVEEIDLALKNVTNAPGQTGQYDLSLKVDRQTGLTSRGSFSLEGPTARASLGLAGLDLRKGWPYLADHLRAPVAGLLDLSAEVSYDGRNGFAAEKGSLTLKNLAARYGDGEGFDLALLAVKDASFRQQGNRLEVGRISLSGGGISLSREADGRLSPLSLLAGPEGPAAAAEGVGTPPAAPPAGATAAKASPPKAAPAPAAKPLAYHLQRIDLDRFDIAFTDKTRPAKPRFTLRDTALSLAGLTGPEARPARFRFAATFGKETPLKAEGDLTPAPFRYKGSLSVGRLPIRDFEAYYPDTLNLKILGGLFDTNLALDVALKDGAPAGAVKGNAGLGDFHTVDAVEEEDLLKWQRLQLDGIDCDLQPLRLSIGEVSLNQVFARIIIREDGTLNLQNLVRKKEGETSAAPPASAPEDPGKAAAAGREAPADAAPEKGTPTPVRIGAFTMVDGKISFTDKHLPDDFDTTFYNLGGRISGLTSEASMTADVDLRGNLENHSPLRITGKINPLRKDLFVDLKLAFSDIELSPMSPYTETYLGYILKQGKLFIDLYYHIEEGKLVSENKIRVDQFTFGDKVESDKATSLPVKLGLALLKDRHGEINLDIPITGRLDDPQFSIWRIVFQVIKNLLVKAVTAPFSLLSSLFAGSGDLSAVAFAPGSSVMQPAEEKKLEALAKGLADRPALKMSLTAYVDREKDAEGYRNELLERKLKREKLLALTLERQLPAGQDAGEIALTPEERPVYLKAAYAREKFPKPRNALGAEISLPDPEMVKLMLANTRVEREELEELARERMTAVRTFLEEKGKLPAERIFEQKDDLFKKPEKSDTPQSRVELNALAD